MKTPTEWRPRGVYTYDVAWILALVVLALIYSVQPAWSALPHWMFAFQNVVPLWVPWAGGLGGVTISLVGVATHTVDWDPSKYGYWHVSRPFLGAVCGTIAILIVVLVLRSVNPPVNGTAYTPGGIAVLAVIAFVVGYREETFRTLVTKVVDVILERHLPLPGLRSAAVGHGSSGPGRPPWRPSFHRPAGLGLVHFACLVRGLSHRTGHARGPGRGLACISDEVAVSSRDRSTCDVS